MRSSSMCRRLLLAAWTTCLATVAFPGPTLVEAQDTKQPAKKDSRAAARPKEATFTTTVTPAEAKPGDTVTYKVTAKVEAPWHIYRYSKIQPNGPKYTEFDFFDPAGLKLEGDWSPSSPPIKKNEPAFPNIPFLEYHEKEVTWSIQLKIPPNTAPGKKPLRCQIGYMICSDENCSFPGQWTLPDTELTVLPASKLLNRRMDAIAPVLVGLIPPRSCSAGPQPKERDTAAAESAPNRRNLSFSTEIHAGPGEARRDGDVQGHGKARRSLAHLQILQGAATGWA